MIGMMLAIAGITLCGITIDGTIVIGGMVIYTFGEMITNPKFNDYMASIAPMESKSLYMGLLNISWAIGLGAGSLLGGWLYQELGEKSTLAARYLREVIGYSDEISATESFVMLCNIKGISSFEAQELLWNVYSPYYFWLIFTAIGLVSLAALFIYSKKYIR